MQSVRQQVRSMDWLSAHRPPFHQCFLLFPKTQRILCFLGVSISFDHRQGIRDHSPCAVELAERPGHHCVTLWRCSSESGNDLRNSVFYSGVEGLLVSFRGFSRRVMRNNFINFLEIPLQSLTLRASSFSYQLLDRLSFTSDFNHGAAATSIDSDCVLLTVRTTEPSTSAPPGNDTPRGSTDCTTETPRLRNDPLHDAIQRAIDWRTDTIDHSYDGVADAAQPDQPRQKTDHER